MTESLVAGLLAGYGVAIPFGAIAFLILDTSIRRGLAHGAAAGLGAALADLGYAVGAALAGAAVADALAPWRGGVRVLSAVVLIACAAWLLRTALRGPSPATPYLPGACGTGSLGRTTARFLALTAINPTTAAFFATVVIGLGATVSSSRATQAVFVLATFAASLSWQLVLAAVGVGISRALPESARIVAAAVGAVLIALLALRLLLY